MAPRPRQRRLDDPAASRTDMAQQQQQQDIGDTSGGEEADESEEKLKITKSSRNEEQSCFFSPGIPKRLRDLLASTVVGRRSHTGRRLIGLAVTALILIGYYRARRNRGRRQQSSKAFQLLSSLSALWKLILTTLRPEHESALDAPLSLLLRAADEGLIQRALLGSSVVYYCLNDNTNNNNNSNSTSESSSSSSSTTWRRSTLPQHGNNPQLHSKVLEKLSSSPNAATMQVTALGESLASRLSTPLLAALPFVYLGLLYRMLKNLHGVGVGDLQLSSSSSCSSGNNSSKKTTFADVAGLDTVVEQVYDVVAYLRDPDRYAQLGARPPRGILLHGPPGGGKTLLARAVAGEANVEAFISCSASEFVEMYVGRGAARVRALFQQARQEARRGAAAKRQEWWWNSLLEAIVGINNDHSVGGQALARKKTAIIFIDELDALAKTRASWNSNDEREQTLNQLLTEMDGFANHGKNSNDKDDDDITLIVMAASNRADVIDPAVLRRFDRQVHVGYPDLAGRRSILQIHARRVLCTPVGTIDWDALALQSDGFSGADLRNAANEAALVAVRDHAPAVDHAHLRDAIQRIAQMKETVQRRPPSHNTSSTSLTPPLFKVDLN